MHALVVYDSVHGNTEQVARVVAAALEPLGTVELLRTTDVPSGKEADAWVFGGPTHAHRMSSNLRGYLAKACAFQALEDVPVATFDTRYRYPALISGSAARSAAGKLRKSGARVVTKPESFFVHQGPKPPDGGKPDSAAEALDSGELDRARAWAKELLPLFAPPD